MKINNIIKNAYDEAVLICESGASQSLPHLFNDPDLTFKDLREIFTKLFTGQINIEEKSDGINLAITYKDGQVMASRNKATLKDPMTIEKLTAKFGGRGELKNAFVNSMKDISKALEALDIKQLNSIFANGQNYISFEIIYPPTKNIIDYGNRCLIQLHGVNVYDEKFNKVTEDKEAADILFNMLKEKDVLKQEMFEITNHTKLQLKDSKTGEESLKLVLEQLEKLIDGLGWNATINDYAMERFTKYIINMATEADFDLQRESKLIPKLANRLNNVIKKRITKADLNTFAKLDGIDPKSQEYKDFVNKIDDTRQEATETVIKPIEDLVIAAGLLLMKNLTGFISTDPQKAAKKLAKELENQIKILSSEETSLDPKKLEMFKKNLAKVDEYQREIMPIEGVVFLYKDKVYKITSTYSYINQLMNILKYKK